MAGRKASGIEGSGSSLGSRRHWRGRHPLSARRLLLRDETSGATRVRLTGGGTERARADRANERSLARSRKITRRNGRTRERETKQNTTRENKRDGRNEQAVKRAEPESRSRASFEQPHVPPFRFPSAGLARAPRRGDRGSGEPAGTAKTAVARTRVKTTSVLRLEAPDGSGSLPPGPLALPPGIPPAGEPSSPLSSAART